MPVNITAESGKGIDYIANATIVGRMLASPIAMGAIITVILFLMIRSWGFSDIGCRHVLHVSGVLVLAFIAHDIIVNKRSLEQIELDKKKAGVGGLISISGSGNALEPRTDPGAIRSGLIQSMPSNHHDDASDGQNPVGGSSSSMSAVDSLAFR